MRLKPISSANPQRFLNGEIHDWYRIVLGYSDQLVARLLDRLGVADTIRRPYRVLDPFCGTGTTLVESMKRGIESVGIDANPSSVFAAKVKTTWNLNPARLLAHLESIRLGQGQRLRQRVAYRRDPTYRYLEGSGMLERGWISPEPLRRSLAIKRCIHDLRARTKYKSALMLALISEVVNSASNVRFGPELYCGQPKADVDVFAGFSKRVETMSADLELVRRLGERAPNTTVYAGDARRAGPLLRERGYARFEAVICSPPYPAEHDYTRNARLELAFLEYVTDITSLRAHKHLMIRSHTKNIYRNDNDRVLVSKHETIDAIANEIDERVQDHTSGFARYYSTVVREYFGGMKRHLRSVRSVLAPGARCAYVVGEQSSYVNVFIPTATILGELAEEVGYTVEGIDHFRSRRVSTAARTIDEHILYLRK